MCERVDAICFAQGKVTWLKAHSPPPTSSPSTLLSLCVILRLYERSAAKNMAFLHFLLAQAVIGAVCAQSATVDIIPSVTAAAASLPTACAVAGRASVLAEAASESGKYQSSTTDKFLSR